MSKTPGVFQLRSGEILKGILQAKLKKNPSYSLRAAARDLGVSHGYLSLVLNGKKRLSFERALQVVQFLKTDEARSELLLRSVALESTKNPACRAFLANSLSGEEDSHTGEFAILELDRFRILSEWYHIAILDLTLVKQFRPDAIWVAARLGIEADQVRIAVARLERLGLLKVTPTSWIKTTARLALPTNHSERAVREFHEQMIDKARETLQSPAAEDFSAREISAITFVVDPSKMAQAKKKIEKFKREMLAFMGDGECTELYQMNVQLFPLMRKED